MRILFCFFTASVLSVLFCSAQPAESPQPSEKKGFFERIKIRKAFESLDDRDEAAIASFSSPKNKENSFLINGGISYNWTKAKHTDGYSVRKNFETFFVINKNTLIDKEQDNFKGGLTSNWMLGSLSGDRLQYWLLNGTLEYVHDRRDTSHSAIATAYIGFINENKAEKSFTMNAYHDIGTGGFQYFVQANAGPEFQNTIDSKVEANKGWAFRLYYGTEFRLGLKKKKGILPANFGKRLVELVVSEKGRFVLADSYTNSSKYLPLQKVELSLYPTLSSDFSLSFSYNNGSDPVAAIAEQQYYLLSVKFKK